MKINKENTKTIGKPDIKHNILVEGEKLEQVDKYKYFSVVVNNEGNLNDEIKERITTTGKLFNGIKPSFLSKKEILAKLESKVIRKIAKLTLLYTCDSSSAKRRQQSGLTSIEIKHKEIELEPKYIETN